MPFYVGKKKNECVWFSWVCVCVCICQMWRIWSTCWQSTQHLLKIHAHVYTCTRSITTTGMIKIWQISLSDRSKRQIPISNTMHFCLMRALVCGSFVMCLICIQTKWDRAELCIKVVSGCIFRSCDSERKLNRQTWNKKQRKTKKRRRQHRGSHSTEATETAFFFTFYIHVLHWVGKSSSIFQSLTLSASA